MRALDAVQFAGNALLTQTRRTLLCLLGVAVGVAAVVLLTALGQGARSYVEAQFAGIGTNVLAVVPGKVKTAGGLPGIGNTTSDLTLADARALVRALPRARAAAPLVVGVEDVSRGARARNAMVLGTSTAMLEIRGLHVSTGSFLPASDWERGEDVAVLGSRTAAELFPGESPLGQPVRIGDWRLRVIGVLESRGVHMGANMDEAVFVPVATGMRMFDRSSLFRILIMLGSKADVEPARAKVATILRERHGREDFTLITPDAVISSLTGILTVLTLALAGIAAISLGVAGIGIMNVMLVAVSERRAEIGLWKALGATPAQVMTLFLLEAVLISAAGALLGLAAGWGLAAAARGAFPSFPTEPPAWALLAALGTALLAGALFGALPARSAVRLDPVAALSRR